jgi:hypothetical protein
MPGGAGHDSQEMARHLPTAMLFVPSLDGRSHSAAEYTSPEDAALGSAPFAISFAGADEPVSQALEWYDDAGT